MLAIEEFCLKHAPCCAFPRTLERVKTDSASDIRSDDSTCIDHACPDISFKPCHDSLTRHLVHFHCSAPRSRFVVTANVYSFSFLSFRRIRTESVFMGGVFSFLVLSQSIKGLLEPSLSREATSESLITTFNTND
jgi:hypothetical protein